MSSERGRWPSDQENPEPQRTDVRIRLIPKRDKNDNTYHIARCDAPMLLDLSKCTIFVFTGDTPEMSIRRTKTE
jgi:hypothetical protein